MLLRDRLKLSFFVSAVFTIMLSCTYQYSLWGYSTIWMVDPLNNLFYVLALYFLIGRRLWAFALTVFIGSINKETMLMLIPLYPLLAWIRTDSWKARETARSIGVSVGVVLLYLLYHVAVQLKVGPGAYQFGAGYYGRSVWEWVKAVMAVRKDVEQVIIFQVFQFLWFFFAYGLYRLYKAYGWRSGWLAISLYLLLTVLLGKLFATDTERVFVMIAPVVLGVCAILFNGFSSERQRLWVAALGFLYIALQLKFFSSDMAWLVDVVAIVIFALALNPAQLDYKRLFAAGEVMQYPDDHMAAHRKAPDFKPKVRRALEDAKALIARTRAKGGSRRKDQASD